MKIYERDLKFYKYINSFNIYNSFFPNLDLTSFEILAFIVTTCRFESNYIPQEESFLYSRDRFKMIFSNDKYMKARDYLPPRTKTHEKAIGNIVYGNRIGNSDSEGYLYRGRGYIQITGKDNYKMLDNEFKNILNLEFNLVSEPHLLLNKAISTLSIFLFLNKNNIDLKNKYNNIEDRFKYMQKIINSRLPKVEYSKRLNFFESLLIEISKRG